jgi:hypothetical protein
MISSLRPTKWCAYQWLLQNKYLLNQPKILGKIFRARSFDTFFETINGSNIGILMFILVENWVFYDLCWNPVSCYMGWVQLRSLLSRVVSRGEEVVFTRRSCFWLIEKGELCLWLWLLEWGWCDLDDVDRDESRVSTIRNTLRIEIENMWSRATSEMSLRITGNKYEPPFLCIFVSASFIVFVLSWRNQILEVWVVFWQDVFHS